MFLCVAVTEPLAAPMASSSTELERVCDLSTHSFSTPGKLKQFVLDLHSGKLHREFHHGPDPTNSTPEKVRRHLRL